MTNIFGQAKKKLAAFARSAPFFKKKSTQKDGQQELSGKTVPEKKILSVSTDPEKNSTVNSDKKISSKAKTNKPRWTLDQFKVVPKEGMSRFHDFDLPLKVMRGIASEKFEYCTPIQASALPYVLEGTDLVGKANTGTGKSAVFLLTIFSRLLSLPKEPQKNGAPRALIVAPTRELVVQIAKDGRRLGQFTGLRIEPVYGGAAYGKQMSILENKVVDVVVATPGRLLDFANKKVVSFDRCKILVIDEADRMLDMGFIPDMRRIISRIPPREKRHTMLFSATVSDDVKRLAYQWCVKPQYVEAESEQVAIDTIEQRVLLVTAEEKYTVLFNLIKGHPDSKIMVFANMKSEVRKLSERLNLDGMENLLLSGDVQQIKREKRLERFRSGAVKVLVATDVAGRGIHIEGINFVVNYTLPYEPEDYVHRIGRTGRAGASGTSVSFACEEGSFYLPDIEEYIGYSLSCTPPDEELLTPVPERKMVPQQKPKRRRRPRRNYNRPKKNSAKSTTSDRSSQ